MNTKAMLILTLAALITGCSQASVATTTTTGSNPTGQTTSSGSGATQPVFATTGSSTSGSNPATVPTTTPNATTSPKPVKAELGQPIIFDEFEITINSIKKFTDGIIVDYIFVNRQEDAFSPNSMALLQISQNGTALYADPSIRSVDPVVKQRGFNRRNQIKKDVPVNLLGFFPSKSDAPVSIQVASRIGSLQRADVLILDFPKEEFKDSKISPEIKLPAGVKPITDNVPALKVGDVLELQTMKIVIDGIYSLPDPQGMNGVVIDYTRTLKSDAAAYQDDFYVNTYHNGIALDPSPMNAPPVVQDALNAGEKKLLPGSSVKGLEYWVYTEEKSDLEIEFNEWKNFKPVKRISVKTVSPTQKITMAQLEEKVKQANAVNNEAAKAFLPQAEDRTLLGKKIDLKNSELTINGVRKSKDDPKNLIMDLTFTKKSDDKRYLITEALILVYQNGVQLDANYNFKDPTDETLSNNLNSDNLNKSVEGILSYHMLDSSMVIIEVYENPGPGKDVGQKQMLVIKP